MCNLLLDLQTRLDCAFVLVSHDLGVVRHLADRITVMHDSRLVESGTAERVCTNPGRAYTKQLSCGSNRACISGTGFAGRPTRATETRPQPRRPLIQPSSRSRRSFSTAVTDSDSPRSGSHPHVEGSLLHPFRLPSLSPRGVTARLERDRE
ncbi:ABC transporter [Natrinema sp. J7-2]|nr:ABC transporter [Natrinema sp. J7-2]